MKTKDTSSWSLGLWTIYFALKVILFWNDTLGFSPLYNFSLLAFVTLPIRWRFANGLRHFFAVLIAIYLLHYDSYLPPLERLTSQWDLISQFDTSYLIELLVDFVSLDFLLLITTLCVGYLYLNQIFRLSTFVILAMVLSSIPQGMLKNLRSPNAIATENITNNSQNDSTADDVIETSPQGLNRYLSSFFKEQATVTSTLSTLDNIEPNFDILFLNICSLAWDDLEFTGQTQHPLLAEFDILFRQFNSATSYSGPAVLRILRANCGQQTHSELFENSLTKKCSLFDNLAELGFEKEVLMNHDGRFDGFSKHIANNIGPFTPAVDIETLSPTQYAFDGTKIYQDSSVLTTWSEQTKSKPTVSLYNTISIHDGNRVVGEKGTRLVTYKRQQKILLDDLNSFFKQLKNSERNIVVIFLPEHGASIRGDRMQISGMREIPTKAITDIPVGIKFFGNAQVSSSQQVQITAPSSYLALSELLSKVLESGMYQGNSVDLNELVKDLPETPFVSQNSGTTMLSIEDRQFYSFDEKSWTEYRQ